MIGYSDTSYTSTLCTPGTPPKSTSPLIEAHRFPGPDKRVGTAIQLTPLWEHVVRTQSVPKDVNLDDIFMALNDRLRDPEWEVRQHALRVLVDVIPVMDDSLDQKMELLLGDLVGNLGHPGPAVRKGALDSLKVYLNHSSHADDILRNIVYRGVEKYAENQLQSDVVVGIILSLPSLIYPGRTTDNTIEYVIKTLVGKLVQVTFQEVSLRSLSRIRDIIGFEEFNKILEETQPNTRRDFELLCQVYDTHGPKTGFNNHETNFSSEDRSKWNDLNANVIHDNRWNSDSDSAGVLSQDENSKSKENVADAENNVPAGKVILETEIQFNSSTAVTMKILEEGESKSVNDSDSDEDNRDCVVKVLSDSDNDEIFELRRRTPRRVRFGGEIVKLRTPDSDSNHPSDTDNDITITTTTSGDPNNPVIEIKFITDENKDLKRSHTSRSLIPVPVTPATHKPKARSLPTSPNRKEIPNKAKLLYQSHPNLTRVHFFQKQKTKPKLKVAIPRSPRLVDNATSPIVHGRIELFHNLTRSPTRSEPEPIFEIKPIEKEVPIKISADRKQPPSVKIVQEAKQKSENITKEKSISEVPKTSQENKKESTNIETSFTTDISDYDSNPGRTYSSFILKDSGSDGIQSDSYIPTADTGDCLTCSSSGSEGTATDNNWENSGIIDKNVIEDMHDKDDWRCRLRGFETLQGELQNPETLQRLQAYLSSFLHFLFNAERHPRLQTVIEDILKNVLSNSSSESLKLCLPQLAMSLSKMSGSVGVRLGLITMKKTSAKAFVHHVMEEPIMSSRSAKCREGALQLVVAATTSFPSTEFDASWLAGRATMAAADRKRRVRQAALDVLAMLAQLARPTPVLDAVASAAAANDMKDREQLVAAVRARLSRRQLPIVEADGTVINASPGVGQGADVDWVAAGSGSMSPCSARSRRRAMTPVASAGHNNNSNTRSESAVSPHKNMWSARRFQDSSESFGSQTQNQHPENMTWTLVPVGNKDDTQNKSYQGTQLWALDQNTSSGDIRLNGSSGSLRPLYYLQSHPQSHSLSQSQPSPGLRLRQLIPGPGGGAVSSTNHTTPPSNNTPPSEPQPTRRRSTSPPVRLVQIRGAGARPSRGMSSSPPEARHSQEVIAKRRFTDSSEESMTNSIRSSPPRSNWRREFQSAIPVPVSSDSGRARFRRRTRDSGTERIASAAHHQPMVALPPHHYNTSSSSSTVTSVTSAPAASVHHHYQYHHQPVTFANGRTKSPSPTRFSVDKYNGNNISKDSTINHNTSSSGSESSDYYTPPAEPYLTLQPSESQPTNRNPRLDSFDQSDRSDTPPGPQQRERFINLEDSVSNSDFDEQEEKKNTEDETDFVRTQVYQKLQEELTNVRDHPFREKDSEKRLSKSHADLSEVKRLARKTISSAPLVKHLRGLENGLTNDFNKNNNTLVEASKSSLNSSISELKSLNESQTELRSINSSISELKSLNQSQTELRSLAQSQLDLQSLNQSQAELRSLHSSQGNISDMRSQTDLRSLNQSQADLRISQRDLRNQSQSDLQSLNDSQTNLQEKEKIVHYPEIVRKKSLPKQKPDLKRRVSNIQSKIPAVFPDTLRNFPKPREGLSEMVSLLESPEWEQSMKGLQNLVRLSRHHQDTVEAQLHSVCVLLGRHIKNLRSQVARAACLAASEMFVIHKKALEPELEELAVPLLQRTADTNKFLRADANAALDAMCNTLNSARVVTVLAGRGANHHNAVIRCTTARLLQDLVHRLGAGRVFQLPKEIREKVLSVGANMLMEGSLETRKHAKNMFLELSSHPHFQRALSEAVSATTLRNISKILNSLK